MSDVMPIREPREATDAIEAAHGAAPEGPPAPDAISPEIAEASVPTSRVGAPRRDPLRAIGRVVDGIGAVGAKELRGRMRGRRAFVILTLYLALLAGFAWMYELILERDYAVGLGQSAAFASARIGQEMFAALILLVTLLVVLLAPAFTAGAISLEREKQTLDMLVATPISSVSIVVGKLLSALTYVFVLIAASIPMTAMVFVFGGVAPDDVIRAYVVLLVTALGLGSFGLCCSSLVKRTQAATVVTVFGVIAITLGSVFTMHFWNTMAGSRGGFVDTTSQQGVGPIKGRPPEALALFNPFLAQADIVCATQTTYGDWCTRFASLFNGQNAPTTVFPNGGKEVPVPLPIDLPAVDDGIPDDDVPLDGGAVGRQPIPNAEVAPDALVAQQFGVARDGFWPKSVVAWAVLSVVFLLLSVQLVSPTRRWRLPRPRRAPRRPA
jgi:ABC-type transport system involved in multi-copper enzyme maturation permease subunit